MLKEENKDKNIQEETELKKFLKNISQIIFFPEWKKLVKFEEPGIYLDQRVDEIIKNNVILLPDLIITDFNQKTGEAYVFLSGVGLYYVQFKLSGKIVTDYREISGIYLPLEIYERAKDAIGLVNSPQLLMTEFIFSIPFILFLQEQKTQMYLRGVISRSIIHPYKDCFDQLLEICSNHNSLSIEDGFKILSAKTNTISTEKNLGSYSNNIAGIEKMEINVDELLIQLQIGSKDMRKALFDKINVIKKDYAEYGFPKLIDWIPK